MEQSFSNCLKLIRIKTQLVACKVEALLKLHQLEDAESSLADIPKFENYPPYLQTKLFGMLVEAYVLYVRAQVEMALGRSELKFQTYVKHQPWFLE